MQDYSAGTSMESVVYNTESTYKRYNHLYAKKHLASGEKKQAWCSMRRKELAIWGPGLIFGHCQLFTFFSQHQMCLRYTDAGYKAEVSTFTCLLRDQTQHSHHKVYRHVRMYDNTNKGKGWTPESFPLSLSISSALLIMVVSGTCSSDNVVYTCTCNHSIVMILHTETLLAVTFTIGGGSGVCVVRYVVRYVY